MSWTGQYRELSLTGWACWALVLSLIATHDETSGQDEEISFALLTAFGIRKTLQTGSVAF